MSRFTLSRTYRMSRSPSPPMDWPSYERLLSKKWAALLESDKQSDESAFHAFLERHPCLLPRYFGGHGVMHSVLFTKPELPGFRAKQPDFMWISLDSVAITADLIEIEAPSKPWKTRSGQPHAKFTQAKDQLNEWKVWFEEPENVIQFRKLFGINDDAYETRRFEQRYVLIYGRRDEATSSLTFAKKRAGLTNNEEIMMSFDRLKPDPALMYMPTVRLKRLKPDHVMEMVQVPPTFRLGPNHAEDWARMVGREAAIRRNPLISPARKAFLVKRLSYWDRWASRPNHGIVHNADLE